MDKRNKQRKNRGKFQSSTSDKKSKDETCGKDVNSTEPNISKTQNSEVSPPLVTVAAACRDDTFKTTGETEKYGSNGCLENKEAVPDARFSKRKIISNWDRYEEDAGVVEGPEPDAQKGSDFRELVDSSSGGTSFFRFKDELEWEDQPTQSTAAEFLSLNCKDLASALLCVPMPARLLIKEELFPKKILKKLETAAKSQEKLYITEKSLSPAVSRDVVNHTTQLLLESCSDKIFNENLDEDEDVCYTADKDGATFTWATSDDASGDNEMQHSAHVYDEPVEDMDTELAKQLPSDVKEQSVTATVETSTTKNTVLSVDDDLEFLLSLSTSDSAPNTKLEAVHSGDNRKESRAESKPSSKNEVKLFEDSSPQNLEDWLDSVLEE